MKNYNCLKEIKDSNSLCENSNCRHFIKNQKNLNCSIFAAEDGPKTLQEIGDYFDLSRMRICQIEKNILEKLRSKLED
jgi:DNA-directed RNA polymerase specialized sigma subunit